MERRALRVEHQAVVEVAAQLAALLGARHEAHLVAELAGQQLLLPAEVVEISRLEGSVEVATAGESALDALLAAQRLDEVDGGQRGGEQLASALAPEACQERPDAGLEAGQDLAAVARARAPPD